MKENKLLIIAIGRCGSTALASALHKAVPEYAKLERIFEPYNKYLGQDKVKTDYEFSNFSVCKTLVHQNPVDYSVEEHYDKLLSHFGKVILLSRKNIEETLTSFVYRVTKSDPEWHNRYFIKDDWDLPLEAYRKFIDQQYVMIDYLSSRYNLPIYYYEDIFTGNKLKINSFIDSIELNLDKAILWKYINPANRERVFNIIDTLI